MDWDAKMMPSWDLATVVSPSSAAGAALDLKLGGPTSWKQQAAAAPRLPPPPSSSSAPAKRPRSGHAQQAVPACSVEGCAADLSRFRDYHRRHKVCEPHSKTPVVVVAGQQQRFCQQCSRFHLLGEFDEIKRSCRKRLDGHNRRRRKPQPDPLNPGGLFANHHGVTRFASYPQLFSAPSMADSKWAATIVKTETDAFDHYYPAIHLNNGAASLFNGKDRKHFPFLTPHGDDAAAALGCQPFTITPSSESSSKQSNSNCALSLLSDNQTPAQLMIPTAQPLGAALQYGNAARLPDDGNVSLTGMSYASVGGKQTSILATSAGYTASPVPATQLQYNGYYHVSGGDQGNPDGAAIQAIPFSSW